MKTSDEDLNDGVPKKSIDGSDAYLPGEDMNIPPQQYGVLHDDEGNIIKVAENAVPPQAWKNQKKAYSDAWENNKNQLLEDDF